MHQDEDVSFVCSLVVVVFVFVFVFVASAASFDFVNIRLRRVAKRTSSSALNSDVCKEAGSGSGGRFFAVFTVVAAVAAAADDLALRFFLDEAAAEAGEADEAGELDNGVFFGFPRDGVVVAPSPP